MLWPWYFVFPSDRVEVFYRSRAVGYTWPLPSHSCDTSPWVQVELADGRRLQTKLLVTKFFISVGKASSLTQVLSTGFGSDSTCAAPPTWSARVRWVANPVREGVGHWAQPSLYVVQGDAAEFEKNRTGHLFHFLGIFFFWMNRQCIDAGWGL